MNRATLKAQIALGEDSTRQFKKNVTNTDGLAAEMAAFANCEGGLLLIGVNDDGSIPGLSSEDVARINQLIGNTASQSIRSGLTVSTENIAISKDRRVIAVTVPKGLDKPYFDRNGVIWLKNGADKRRIHSKEELRRLFQGTHQFHADELPTKAGLDRLDRLRFRDFLRATYDRSLPESDEELSRLLQNMNLVTEDGRLNLAGVLLFGENPEWVVPQFAVKCIRYPGNEIHADSYLDTEDYAGPMDSVFQGALGFIMRNLHKVQAGQNVNAPGRPEIAKAAFEELLVNALAHRDYLINAPIRVFIFDDRIELISPGVLPNNLTVEKIKAGNSNIRNPILVSYIAKGLLPYHGLGSGIQRALKSWPWVDFNNDREGNLFAVTVHRNSDEFPATVAEDPLGLLGRSSSYKSRGSSYKAISSPKESACSPKPAKSSLKTEDKILEHIREDHRVTAEALASILGISKRAVLKQIAKLKRQKRLNRVGAARGGHWEVL